MMLLYLWQMLLLVVGWITVAHFSGVSLSSIFINYSASKTVQIESYQIPVDTLVYLLFLRNCIGFLMNTAQSLKQPLLFISFSTLVFPSILLHTSLPTAVPTVPGTVRVLVISLFLIPKFQPSIHKSVKQFGYSFAFDAPTVWNALPEKIRESPSLASFRKCLKTYLYTKAYPP